MMGRRWLIAGAIVATSVTVGCSDVVFGVSTGGFDGQANIVIIFGNELVIATRMISSTDGSGQRLDTTVEIAGTTADVARDLTADSLWLSSGGREWGFALAPADGGDNHSLLTAVGPAPPWPPGTRADARIRWRQDDRTQTVELEDLRVEGP